MTTTTDSLIDAQPEEVGMSSRALANVDSVVQRYIDDGKYPGAIAMVARHDQVVHFQTYGNMDDEAGKEMRPDAIVRAYSMTKPIASGGRSMLTPSATRVSAAPDLDDSARLPCLAILRPAPAATSAAQVEML